jgi:hypothetical protein
MEDSTHRDVLARQAPVMLDWDPALHKMIHPRLGPPTWHPELEARIFEIYPCITRISSVPTSRIVCPCGRVIWNMAEVVWPEGPDRRPGVYELTGMSLSEVHALLDRILPLEIQA